MENYPYGTRRYSLDDDSIVVIEGAGSVARSAVDEWANVMIDSIQHYRYILSDNTNRAQGFSPYLRLRAEDIYQTLPNDRQTVGAFIFGHHFMFRLMGLIAQRMLAANKPVSIKLFTEREKALEWLRQQRETHQY